MAENLSVQQHSVALPLPHQSRHSHQQEGYAGIDLDAYRTSSPSLEEDVDDEVSTDGSEELHSSLCKKCSLPINEGHAYELGEDHWHTYCFKCSKCEKLLGVQSNFLVLGTGALVCSSCSYSCKNCGKKIDDLAILTGDQAYCSSCFCCRSCKKKIEDLRYARTSKGLFCMPCHERLLDKKRKQDAAKRQLLQQQSEQQAPASSASQTSQAPAAAAAQRPNVARAKSSDRRSVITNDMLDKNLPDIPFDSVSSSSSNMDALMSPQLTKDSNTSKNNVSSKEDHLDVILDIPARSPQRNAATTLAPPPSIETTKTSSTSDLDPAKIQDEDTITNQSLPYALPLSSPIPGPTPRAAPLSPHNAANRKAVIMDSVNDKSERIPHLVQENDDDSYIEMDINIDSNLASAASASTSTSAKGLNIENLNYKQDQQSTVEQDFVATPNNKGNFRGFKFGSSGTPKSPTREKISQGISRSMSIKSPRNYFQRHKRSISGSLDLSNDKEKTPLAPTDEQSTTQAFRTPPVPYESKFSRHEASPSGHIRAISDTPTFDTSLQSQTELELRTLKAEIHNMTAIKSSLKTEIDSLSHQKEKLGQEILEQQKLLEQLKTDRTVIYSSKMQSSSSSSVLNDYYKTSTPTPSNPSMAPRSSSSNNLDESAIVQVEDIVEAKPKAKARFWRKPKLTKTKDLVISSPSTHNISRDLDDSFVTNLEENSKLAIPKIFQSGGSNNSSAINVKKIDPKELFGASLEARCQYEKRSVPFIVTKCIEQIELKGLKMEGIYRISGGTTLIEKLEVAFRDFNPDSSSQYRNLNELMEQDIHAVSGILKRYLRKLPNPIIPYDYYSSFIELSSVEQSIQLQQAKSLVQRLPELNLKVLIIILSHLLKIFENSAVNKMTLKNISVVFGPTLMRDVNPEKEIIDMGSRTNVLEYILHHFNEIF